MTTKINRRPTIPPSNSENRKSIEALNVAVMELGGVSGNEAQRAVRVIELIDAGILKYDVNGLVVVGSNDDSVVHIGGTETIKGHKAFEAGIDFGSVVASTAVDLSKHIALHGSTWGFNVRANMLNIVAGAKPFSFIADGSSSYVVVPSPAATAGFSQVALTGSSGLIQGGMWANGSTQAAFGGINSVNFGSNENVQVVFVQGNALRGLIDTAGVLVWNKSIQSTGSSSGLFTQDRSSLVLTGLYADAGNLRLWHGVAGDMLSMNYTTGNVTAKGAVLGHTEIDVQNASNFVKMQMHVGDSARTGYMAWFNPSAVRCGYFGYGLSPNLLLNVEAGFDTVVSNCHWHTANVRPISDNAWSCGVSGGRWSVVYAATGSINTSDARDKTPVRGMDTPEIEASKALAREIGVYQFLSAIALKGDDARWHVGMTVQRAIEIMTQHGLDPLRYGFICYDEWPSTEAIYGPPERDEEGNEMEPPLVQEAVPAGNRYSFRPDELLMFMARGFEARLAALENA